MIPPSVATNWANTPSLQTIDIIKYERPLLFHTIHTALGPLMAFNGQTADLSKHIKSIRYVRREHMRARVRTHTHAEGEKTKERKRERVKV